MTLTNTQLNTIITQVEPILRRMEKVSLALSSGQLENELGQTITLTDIQIANALAALKTISTNLNALVQAL